MDKLFAIADEIVFSSWLDCEVHSSLEYAFDAGFAGVEFDAYKNSTDKDADYMDSAYNLGVKAQNYKSDPEGFRQYLLSENS